jgi:Spy/CpxP family protein refolding chaperone
MLKRIHRLILVSLSILLCTIAASAQAQRGGKGKAPSKGERNEWMAKMRQYKHDFIARELGLTEKQKTEFFAIYDSMEKERMELEGKVRETERQVRARKKNATSAELDRAIKEMFDLDGKQNAVIMKYLPKLKKVLTKQQLFDLKRAERNFQRDLMEQQRQGTNGAGATPPPPGR